MPPKRSKKISTTKVETGNIKQVVNVRVGDQYTKTKRVSKKTKRYYGGKGASRYGGGGGGGDGGLAIFSRPPILTNMQSPVVQQPSYVNEYNMLLRELANERKQRQAAAPPLQPNTTPLTTNMQRNELLATPTLPTPLEPITKRFSEVAEMTIDKETYDDPQTNENMFSSPPSLAYNLSQKLPIGLFDEEDLEEFDNENDAEQEALEKQAKPIITPTTEKKIKLTSVLRLNITNALTELGLTTNKKDNQEKQEILRQALGDSYIAGKQPSKYSRIADLEKILAYLRSLIRQRGLKDIVEEPIPVFAKSKI